MRSIPESRFTPGAMLRVERSLSPREVYVKLAIILSSAAVLIFAYVEQTRERMFELLWTSPWGRLGGSRHHRVY